jgi:serine protease AprX
MPGDGPHTSASISTRARQARVELVGADGHPLDGTGVSVAVVDTGVDATHPSFRLGDGSTKVVRQVTTLTCAAEPLVGHDPSCVSDLDAGGDSDAGHGGHGTFAASTALGNELELVDGTHVDGVAPGARLVMIVTTATLVSVETAFAWVLEHHAEPCGSGVAASVCPPIRVVSASWGANSAYFDDVERRLAAAGVVVAWANGNQGGDGSTSASNPTPARDPTPGVLAVASYDDKGTGTRDGELSSTSARGAVNDPTTWPDISAPGVNILGACRPYHAVCEAVGTHPKDGPGPDDRATFYVASGSSWAAPAVAGVVAVLFQARPNATAAEIDDALKATAYRYGGPAAYATRGSYPSSFDKGAGLIDAYAAAVLLGAKPVLTAATAPRPADVRAAAAQGASGTHPATGGAPLPPLAGGGVLALALLLLRGRARVRPA